MDIEYLKKLLREHEGVRSLVYDDATGKPLTKGDTCIGLSLIDI